MEKQLWYKILSVIAFMSCLLVVKDRTAQFAVTAQFLLCMAPNIKGNLSDAKRRKYAYIFMTILFLSCVLIRIILYYYNFK